MKGEIEDEKEKEKEMERKGRQQKPQSRKCIKT